MTPRVPFCDVFNWLPRESLPPPPPALPPIHPPPDDEGRRVRYDDEEVVIGPSEPSVPLPLHRFPVRASRVTLALSGLGFQFGPLFAARPGRRSQIC